MKEILLATKGIDAARRQLCQDQGRVCCWNWSEPILGGTPGHVVLSQDAWCETCGRERGARLTLKVRPTDLAPTDS